MDDDTLDESAAAGRSKVVKSETAFRTIGEVSAELGIAQHVLRYWEGRFPQLKPLQRAGNRRYYRPEDVALVRRIRDLLDRQGYTMRGVQQMLAAGAGTSPAPATAEPTPSLPATAIPADRGAITAELRAIRDALAAALQADLAVA